jgi:hypothetical protein
LRVLALTVKLAKPKNHREKTALRCCIQKKKRVMYPSTRASTGLSQSDCICEIRKSIIDEKGETFSADVFVDQFILVDCIELFEEEFKFVFDFSCYGFAGSLWEFHDVFFEWA